MMRVIACLLFLSGAVACKGKSDAPDCKAAASSYAQLVKDQIDRDSKDDESRRAQALSLIPSLKEEMARTCEKNKWTETTRACIKNAKTAADLPHCMPKKPESEAPAAPAETTPAEQPTTGG
jgi:small lipoprotein (TIGR04454 family)